MKYWTTEIEAPEDWPRYGLFDEPVDVQHATSLQNELWRVLQTHRAMPWGTKRSEQMGLPDLLVDVVREIEVERRRGRSADAPDVDEREGGADADDGITEA